MYEILCKHLSTRNCFCLSVRFNFAVLGIHWIQTRARLGGKISYPDVSMHEAIIHLKAIRRIEVSILCR